MVAPERKMSVGVLRSFVLHGVNMFSERSLQLISKYPSQSQRILLSGSSGLIGSHLLSFLNQAGHTVIRLVRNQESLNSIYWDPSRGIFQLKEFENFDVMIHLAGENIADKPWTKKRKELLKVSRCRDSLLLSQILFQLSHPPKVVICASAIGFYGSRGKEVLTEKSQKGNGFLADLCEQWEQSMVPLKSSGVRVVHARFGVVLSPVGGMLKKLLLPFKLGLGGRIGSGDQIMSWVGLDDVIGAIYHILMTQTLVGAVNIVAPEPISQKGFAKMLAARLHRPAWIPIPDYILRWVFGEMADELFLASAYVKGEKLLDSGYCFFDTDLGSFKLGL